MPLDSRAEYNALLESSRLDELLSRAREQTKKMASNSAVPAEQALQQVEDEVSKMNEKSAMARQDLLEILQNRNKERAEKVAAAVHIYRVATRLVS